MYYNQDEFFRLMESIEDQGGTHLDETHDPVYFTDLVNDHGTKGFELVYCGADAMFEIPYDDGTHAGGSIKVCAVDDWIGRWPRFAEARAVGVDS